MIEITAINVTKEFGARTVFRDVSFTVDGGHKVGLVGKNGCGKTTLLHVLTGALQSDGGSISIAPGRRVGLLSQIPNYPPHMTGEEVIKTAFERLNSIKAELSVLEVAMQSCQDKALLAKYGKLFEQFEHGGGFTADVDFAKVKNGLGISQDVLSQEFEKLSGGERTRINLARLLLQQTEILLLDEPTNHLDLEAVEWLEEFLATYKGTVLVVSHDRVFLDKVITRVLELENGVMTAYTGNYSQYVAEKDQRRQHQLNTYTQEQRKIRQLLDTARVMHERGTEKQHKTAFAIEKRAARMATVDKPPSEKKLKAAVSSREFKGDELLTLHGIGKSYGEKVLFDDIKLQVKGQERIAIMGGNGTGKTTLLNILQEQEPHEGQIRYNPSVRLGYLPQIVQFSVPTRSLVDTLLYELDCSVQTARDRLGAFGFLNDDVFKPVNALSGGEKSRLKLCLLLFRDVNLLLMDEPTNHLDIAARQWMEDVLTQYDQALLFVSHDRAFIGKFAQRIWLLEGQKIHDYAMEYEQYKIVRTQESKSRPLTSDIFFQKGAETVRDSHRRSNKNVQTSANKDKARKDKTKQRLLEQQLNAIDEKLADIAREIEENASNASELQWLVQEQGILEQEKEELYAQWFAIEE
ncbi:MAG: ABC-F family ATP-binding cassette domain-containing protein [Oscillospiraceae bacterium]|nr:ABC-F family ATP-binding cassette domain-containing protein [Oscillospiraceae bacterium]